MESNKEELDNLINDVKDYLETRTKLGRLKALDKGSQIAGDISVVVFLSLFGLLFLLFISIAASLALSEILGKFYLGFLAVSLFYLFIGVLLYIKRESWIHKPIVNALIRDFFKDTKDEN
ncbi:MAG: hypothetical protein EYC69_06565 [Bacteroidetes bacterium]|nr:MAG: hypothetical protein EYC69_06565 [Bacteroidota bacterium]